MRIKWLSLLLLWVTSLNIALGSGVAQKCARIVSLSPSITDTLLMLDLEENIVGVTRFCTIPKASKASSVGGGVIGINYEAVVSLTPSIIFMQEGRQSNQQNFFKRFNLEVANLSFISLDDILENLNVVGAVCNISEKTSRIKQDIEQVLQGFAKKKPINPPNILILYGFNHDLEKAPPKSAAGASYHNEMIELLGGTNAYTGKLGSPQLSQEAILMLNPDIIIVLSGDGETPAFDARYDLDLSLYESNWPLIASVNAIKNHKVYVIKGFASTIPSPKAIEHLAKVFAKIIGD